MHIIGWKRNNYVMCVGLLYAKNAINRSYAPPLITGEDSLLAFPSKLKALLVLVVVHMSK